ncbi:Uncharacterized protein HZ326_30342, partial [Fusarium oxysporum f. sp. albedinis]
MLADHDASPVGKRWAHNFVKRQPELKTHLFRKHDYQRAKCEDPTIIRGWFRLVQNTIAKYGIRLDDIWNFDETGFMMGLIMVGMLGLEWLKYFDRSTTNQSTGPYRLLILDGHESHHSADSERYCKDNKIIT